MTLLSDLSKRDKLDFCVKFQWLVPFLTTYEYHLNHYLMFPRTYDKKDTAVEEKPAAVVEMTDAQATAAKADKKAKKDKQIGRAHV